MPTHKDKDNEIKYVEKFYMEFLLELLRKAHRVMIYSASIQLSITGFGTACLSPDDNKKSRMSLFAVMEKVLDISREPDIHRQNMNIILFAYICILNI